MTLKQQSINVCNEDDDDDQYSDTKRAAGYILCCFECKACLVGLLIGALVASIGLAVILTLWLKPLSTHNSQNGINTNAQPAVTTTITSTGTTVTTTTTTSTSTQTTTTSVTSAATSTSVSTTSSTSTTTSVTTTSTATTSTSTTTTTTSTASTTTTTTGCTSCTNYCWNQTGIAVAGTSSSSISNPTSIYIDSTDIIYLSGHNIGQVLMCPSNGTTTSAATVIYGDHIDYITFDKIGYMYTNDHASDRVRNYAPGSPSGTIVAGTGSSVSGTLSHPTGIAIDDSFNLYIADQSATRVVQLAPNASSLITVINTSSYVARLSALLLPHGTPNQIYMSDESGNNVFLWIFGDSTPNVTYTNVISSPLTLSNPRGMKRDPQGNLYVADMSNSRIVMYCVNSTVGNVVITTNYDPVDIAFDSHMNMYAFLANGKVMKYELL
ncbi:hypothetical protein I4U23_004987 [Adineta vaga]|nr:hypothetical protein I4U23_004987 [Adineta vaga]